jgi:hypothetical protein
MKGYGKFNMNKEINDSECCICRKLLINVNNMGLFQGRIIGSGKIKGSKKSRKINYIQ